MAINKTDIGSYFLKTGEITEKELAEAYKIQEKTGKRLEVILQEERFLTEDKIKNYLRSQYNIVSVDLKEQSIDPVVPLLISEGIAREHILFPFKKSQYRLLVAMVDPYDLNAIKKIHTTTGLTVLPRKAKARDIMQMIEKYYAEQKDAKDLERANAMLEKSLEMARLKAEQKAKQKEMKLESENNIEKNIENPEKTAGIEETNSEIVKSQELSEDLLREDNKEDIIDISDEIEVGEFKATASTVAVNSAQQDKIIELKKRFSNKKAKLGAVLVEAGIITQEQLDLTLNLQKKTKNKLGEILVDNGIIKENELVNVLSDIMGFPRLELNKHMLDPKIPALIKESLARKYVLIPAKIENGRLNVAMSDPLNVYAIDDISIATGYSVVPHIAGRKEILRAIELYYGQQSTEDAVEDLMREIDTDEIKDLDQEILHEINNAPLVRLVNSLLRQAITLKASDLHIEPFENYVRVRFRIDGDLQEIMSLDINTHPSVVARIKIMGKMDIAEKRVPQDGRVGIRLDDRLIDLRLSTLPTSYGEKVVIRVLDRENILIQKSQLGFTEKNIQRLNRIIQYPYGIILATGPTGCGKTSTLYTILSELNKINRNIITVEDPIEFKLNGINQVQVNPKANLTFASGLRSILRQDPDIIMIGEIRDTETVQIAVRAAITGHLVLSTIHTNDTASTIVRLIDMGVEPYLISSSIVGIISQRLVKKICPDCKEEYLPTDEEKNILKIDNSISLYCGKGCSSCNNTGYKGRIAVAEIMHINSHIKKHIDERETSEIKEAAKEYGMTDIEQNCRELVLNGITTIDEFIRNTYIF